MLGISGITGIIGGRRNEQQGNTLTAMLGCLRRTLLDECGTLIDERVGLWVGWVRRESAASQFCSLWNERRDICLVFSGEDYRGQGEINQLQARGHEFDADRAGYLVHMYEEFGLKFLEKLNGTFRGLLVDLPKQKIVLFNDRYGVNRLYFHENDDGFYFSSEAKSLLKVLPHVRALDPRSLGEFISCGCVLQNRTIFRGISLMPGGSAWTFHSGENVRKEFYFTKEPWEQQPLLTAAEYYERLREIWKRLLPRYFHGGERVALSLTGGVDSRMILAWAPCPSGALPCYTFGSRYRDCADVKISREVAKICRQNHEVIEIGSEFLSRFPDLAQKTIYISDGAMDVTGSVDLYVQERMRQIAPVRISGTNGGEILRHLVAFKPASCCRDLLTPEMDPYVRMAAATYVEELNGHRLSFAAFKQASWFMGCKFAVERSDMTLRMPYFDNELIALVYQAPAECTATNRVSQRLIEDGNPRLGHVPTDRGGSLKWFPGRSKARQLFQELTFKAEYAYDYGMPRTLARFDHALASLHLERLFLGRHKIHHFRVFYRDEHSDYLREVLLDARSLSRPYVRSAHVAEMINGHLKGNRNCTTDIHKLLTVELIQRELIERE